MFLLTKIYWIFKQEVMDLKNMVIGILIGMLLLLFALIGITQCTDKNNHFEC